MLEGTSQYDYHFTVKMVKHTGPGFNRNRERIAKGKMKRQGKVLANFGGCERLFFSNVPDYIYWERHEQVK